MRVIDFNEDETNELETQIKTAKRKIDVLYDEPVVTKVVLEEENDNKEDEEQITGKMIAKEILSVIINVVICFVLVFFITHFIGQRTVVSGSSMEDTLSNGDNLIVDRISYRFNDPQRFDVIVFPYMYEEDTYYIKRIIGLPGERVYIDPDGNIYINGELLQENYGTEVISNAGLASSQIILGDDEYFVLGDNRNNSTDSRFDAVGNIKGDDIVGRAWVRLYPFNEICFVSNLE